MAEISLKKDIDSLLNNREKKGVIFLSFFL